MGLPVISVEFKKLAATATTRSTRGVLAVILQDATSGVTWTNKAFTSLDEVDEKEFSDENYKILSRAFLSAPYQVIVVRVGSEGTMETAQAILDKLSYNWVCAVPANFQAGLVTYVKGINTPRRIRKVKALVYNQTSADDMHIVSVSNGTVTLTGGDTVTMTNYLPRLAGLLAACPMDQSVTYAALDDLEAVADVSNLDTAIDGGSLCLFRDDNVIRIARGVNTLQTVSGDVTEDMKKIAVVEAMDLIQEDIIRTFKLYYLGKKKNTADNQALFVADVSSYLRALAEEGVVNKDETISVSVDVAAMRAAWEAAGVSTADMKDAQVKKKPFRAQVFVAAQAHILDAMEDMTMVFTMG